MNEKKSEIRSYHDLVVWRMGITLAKQVYMLAARFPKHEAYGLAEQIRRAAVSVPSNIAEGQARHSRADFRRFLFIALGSLAEVDTQFTLAQEFGYLPPEDLTAVHELITDLRMKTYALINTLPSRY
ncbi:MAG: four helix bundle protein [Chloroflexi bacterium]|nr:four helix bundle protein [Chloroflexota bacterium]